MLLQASFSAAAVGVPGGTQTRASGSSAGVRQAPDARQTLSCPAPFLLDYGENKCRAGWIRTNGLLLPKQVP